ncbi:C4-dicarboxylate TRAP transporter substrate-binding protein [Paracoccus sp. (in: a-proteobacteria)]|uniref:C4-dicarboxylate TRAP transporter substrate-binding protein n=1 Tax=Paracoccus sp. TaxID=267 RepID=UPI002AFEF131|nr:C4-dicarboxylate TRAP transporter substrate-binding protein [Paracoccus sp. (in: a-proteobacteria)]
MKLTTTLAGSLCALMALSPIQKAFAQDIEYPTINLRFAQFINSTLPQSKNMQQWADRLKERSGGKITVEFFWSESLGGATELMDLVSAGAVDLVAPAPSYFPTELPLTNITQLPIVFPTAAAAQLLAEHLDNITGVQKENEDANVVPLFWTSIPPYHVLCNKPISTVSDFRGVRVRSYGEFVPRMWESIGAVPVTTTSPEVYEGLQRGLIDCSYLPNDFALAYKLHEVAKYYVDANFGAIIGWPIYLNRDVWESWPQEVRDLVKEVSAEAAQRDRDEMKLIGEEATKSLLDGGLELVVFQEPDALKVALPDMLALWTEQMTQRGLGEAAEAVAEATRARIAEAQE